MEAKKDTSGIEKQETKRCLCCGRKMSTALKSNYCTVLCEAASIPFSKEEAF